MNPIAVITTYKRVKKYFNKITYNNKHFFINEFRDDQKTLTQSKKR